MGRLGDRATVDDPIFGRTSGMPALGRYIEEVSAWLQKHEGAFDKVAFVTGSDRDVTEGTLALTFEGRRVQVPVAVVAERRPEREVEVAIKGHVHEECRQQKKTEDGQEDALE